MKEENPIKIKEIKQLKRLYKKPVLSKIQLVAEEAVLAYCKTGINTMCMPNPICDRIHRS
jgi:hypothetical protein